MKKLLSILLAMLMILSLLPIGALATEDGAHAGISITVKASDGESDPGTITVNTPYKVKVTVQNTGTYVISPTVTLYEVRDGENDAVIGKPQPTNELAAGAAEAELVYLWTPAAAGTAHFKAVVTADIPDETPMSVVYASEAFIVAEAAETPDAIQTEAGEETAGPAVELLQLPEQEVDSGAYSGQTDQGTYTISSAEQLASLAQAVEAGTTYLGSTFTLTKDISLSSVCGATAGVEGASLSWTPIGMSTTKPFAGSFDGGGHTISGLYINASSNYQGLFGYAKEGTIKNLVVGGSITNTYNYTGGIVGQSMGIVSNCLSSVNINATGSAMFGGGIVGYVSKLGGSTVTPSLSGCVYTGQVDASTATNKSFGSIAGAGMEAYVNSCYSINSVSPDTTVWSGNSGMRVTPADYSKAVWGLNTLNGKQAGSGAWTYDDTGLHLGAGTIYRVRLMNMSPAVTLSFSQNDKTVASYTENTFYTVVYIPAGTLSVMPSAGVTGYTIVPLGTAPETMVSETGFSVPVSADAEYNCGWQTDVDTNTSQKAKITWYSTTATSFTLATAEDLVGLKMLVAGQITGYSSDNFSGKTVTLANDVSLSPVCGPEIGDWSPVGTEAAPFAGTFNGGGHMVSSLYINGSSDNQGLLGYVTGTVTNLAVSGALKGGANVGAVAGKSLGSITNCLSLASVSGTSAVGGVVGAGNTVVGCIHCNSSASIGVAGSAMTVKGCYYLSDSAIAGALGQNVPSSKFATREMAYKADTASGSHAGLWQAGISCPELGINTVTLVTLTQAYAQAGKSVTMVPSGDILITTNGGTQSAYLVKDEKLNLTVTNDDPTNQGPVFSPGSSVTESGGTYAITGTSSDAAVTYRFAQSIGADTNWYDAGQTEYTLITEAQLRGLASLVNSGTSFAGKIVKLGADITVAGGDWPMIGINKTSPFLGTFDGQNHTVSGFYVKITGTDANSLNYQGFFGGIGDQSTVRNLKLDGTVADARYFAGILAGYATSYCTITNCTTSGTVSYTSSAITQIGAAGMVGDLDQYGVMTDCVNNANVSITLNTGAAAPTFTMGGLIAFNDPYSEVTNCVNNGTLTVTSNISTAIKPLIGGITGYASNVTSYKRCINNGAITVKGLTTNAAKPSSIGGIVGSATTAAVFNPATTTAYVLEDCRNTAPVTCEVSGGSVYVGGIVGGSNGTTNTSSTALNLSVVNCENTGNVSVEYTVAPTSIYVGGIVGGTNIALSLVSGCTNKASVTLAPSGVDSGVSTGTNNGVGGIAGKAFTVTASGGTITRCVNSGEVSSAAPQTGGIAGAPVSGINVTDCYNLATVSGSGSVGGIVGVVGGTLCSVFNYGEEVKTTGATAGLVAGSGATSSGIFAAYVLDTTRLTGVAAPADAVVTQAVPTEKFKSFDLLYALNSAGRTAEDRGIWTYVKGTDYPVFAAETPALYYAVTAATTGNGAVQCSQQYLTAGKTYTVTFTPDNGYMLKDFTVKDIDGNSYIVLLNSVVNGVYSVTLKAPTGSAYAATFKDNVLSCTMAGHSLTFTGGFAPAVAGGTAIVTLDGNGGWFGGNESNTLMTVNVATGSRLTLADFPQPAEYRLFLGWFADKDGTIPYNFSTVLSGDTTIYAKWDENSRVVFYQLNGGSWSGGEYTAVTSGSKLAVPSGTPVKSGYSFVGWYGDEACLTPFDFTNTAITRNLTLYAGWVPSGQHQVIVDANGGAFPDSAARKQQVFSDGAAIGSVLDALHATNGDKVLRGWYTAANGGSKWDLNTVLSDDIILYAHWDEHAGKPAIYKGSAESPMEIEDLAQLLALRDSINAGNAYAGGYFKLAADLTLPEGWAPIGTLKPGAVNEGSGANIYPFSGTFDGGYKTITILRGGLPLFKYVRMATVRNLNIYGTQIAGYGLVNTYTIDYGPDGNYNTGEDGGSYTPGCPDTVIINNVTLKAGSSTLYSGFIGGAASGANVIIIRNSTIESGVVIGYDKGQNNIASFGGAFNGIIENCSSGATVYGIDNVGGIVATKGQSMGTYRVNGCTFSGAVVATGSFAGGIAASGYSSPSAPNSPCASVQNCLVTGSVTGANNVGGIFGGEPAVTQCWANGIGYIRNNCFAGTLTATAQSAVSGGIIGYMKTLDRYNIIENNYYLKTAAAKGIGDIGAIDYTTDSYKRAVNPFVADDVCIPATPDDFASGKIAALLNSGENSIGTWTQSDAYPFLGTAATAVHTVSLNITGSGKASLTGMGSGSTAYQKAGGKVKLAASPDQGSGLYMARVTYGDTTVDITDSREFTMPQQDATVYVVFAAWGEKTVSSIHIATQPNKTSYLVGESFDIAGLTITVNYNDNTSEALPVTTSMVSGFSSASAGTKTLTVTYKGSIATFKVSVLEQVKSDISVTFSLLGDTVHHGGAEHTLKAGNLVTWISPVTVSVKEGSYVGDVFAKVLDAKGYTYKGLSNNYISSVTTPGGIALAEFTNGNLSGWMYTLNGTHPLYGLLQQKVSDGDVIVWHYTDNYTQEEGSEKWDDSKGSTTGGTGDTKKAITLKPTATVNSGTASVSLSLTDVKDAIASVKTSGGDIVIAPSVNNVVTAVRVALDKETLSAIVGQTSASVTVQTPVGNITLPNAALDSIAAQVSGSTVTIGLGTVEKTALTAGEQKVVGDNTVYDISILSGDKKITGFNGESITVSLPYTLRSGEDASGVTVWYLNGKGELERMSCKYDKAIGLAIFTTTHLSKYLVGYLSEEVWHNPFTDVTDGDWFYKAVEFSVQNGLFNGTSETTFSPNTDMTRAMLMTVLYRMDGKPAVTGKNPFTDVKPGQWYTDAVSWANANRIVSGYGGGRFGANDSLTREQLAVILLNFAKYKNRDVTKTAALTGYTDGTSVGSWAAAAMQWTVAEGLITGTSKTTLSPTVSASRVQVATILMRFIKNVAE